MIGRKGHGCMRRFPILLVAALALVSGARAEGLTLPQALTEIEAEAFRADTSLVEVIVPEGVVSIGENAFSDCANLRRMLRHDANASPDTGLHDERIHMQILIDSIAQRVHDRRNDG